MDCKNPISRRPLDDHDIGLLASWLNKDYVSRWYDAPEDWLREIRGRHGSFSWIRHFMFSDSAATFGFGQYYDCFHAQEDWYSADLPDDTFSIDYLIGEESYLGKGYGKAIVASLTSAVASCGKARRIIVQPEKDNAASIRALEANGYVYDERDGYYCRRLG